MIAIFLPTRDALSLRLAYRSFLDLYWSVGVLGFSVHFQRRKSSRVRSKNKRGVTELLSLYRATTHSLDPPGLRNRQRIWDFAGLLIEIARQAYVDDNLRFDLGFGALKARHQLPSFEARRVSFS
jgi:hypothetical protein